MRLDHLVPSMFLSLKLSQNKVFFLVFVLLLSILAVFDYPMQPKLVVSELNHDFGTVGIQQTLTNKITLTNTGKKTILISKVSSTCGCTIGSLSDSVLTRGKSTILTVKLITKSDLGVDNQQVILTTTDAAKKIVTINLRAVVDDLCQINPHIVDFGYNEKDQLPIRREIVITANPGHALPSDLTMCANVPYLTCELQKPVDGKTLHGILTLDRSVPTGSLSGIVSLHSSVLGSPHVITIGGKIVGNMHADPDFLYFAVVSSRDELVRRVTLHSPIQIRGQIDLTVEPPECQDAVHVRMLTTEILEISVVPPAKGRILASIVISSPNNEFDALRLPIIVASATTISSRQN